MIDLKEKTVMYFDSMGGDNHACHSALRVWLVAEAKDKKGSVLDLAGWKTATPKVSLVHSVATITLDMYVYTYVRSLYTAAYSCIQTIPTYIQEYTRSHVKHSCACETQLCM